MGKDVAIQFPVAFEFLGGKEVEGIFTFEAGVNSAKKPIWNRTGLSTR